MASSSSPHDIPVEMDLDSALKRYQAYVESGQAEKDGNVSFMQFMGKPNAATAVAGTIHKNLQNRVFASETEIHAHMEAMVQAHNEASRPEFLGLGSSQIHRLLSCEEFSDLNDIVHFSDRPFSKCAESSRLLRILRFLLESYEAAKDELPITATGNYKPALVQEVLAQFYAADEIESFAKTENQVPSLNLVHDFLIDYAYVMETTSKSRLNDWGKDLYRQSNQDLWKKLFDYFVFDTDWLSFTRQEMHFPRSSLIQDAALIMLHILSARKSGWTNVEIVYADFRRAFPDFDPHYGQERYELGEIMFDILFVKLFCAEMGLIEYAESSDIAPALYRRGFRTTALLGEAFDWHI